MKRYGHILIKTLSMTYLLRYNLRDQNLKEFCQTQAINQKKGLKILYGFMAGALRTLW